MIVVRDRPVGIWVLSLVLLLEGLGSLAEAFWVTWMIDRDPWRTSALTILGLALVYKAHGIWTLRLGAWVAVLLVICLKTLVNLLTIVFDPLVVAGYIDLAGNVIAVLFLIHPNIRSLFSKEGVGI